MMTWMGVGAGLAVIELSGAALLTLLCRDLRRWSPGGRAGIAFGLGLVALTTTLFLASMASIRPAPWIGTALLIVLWGSVGWLRRRQAREWLRFEPPRDLSRIALVSFLVGLVAVVGTVSVLEPIVEWDVVAIWALKAEVLLDEPVATSPYFRDLGKAYSHLDYPLLWPLSMAWLWSWAGGAELEAVKLLAPALLAAFAAAMVGLLRRRLDGTASLMFAALLMGMPMLLSQSSRLMADVPLALFVVAAFGCGYLWLEEGHLDDLRLATAFACGMLFCKNEGLGLWLILVGGVGASLLLRRQYRRLLPALVGFGVAPLIVTAPWFLFRAGLPKVHENYAARLFSDSLWELRGRLPEVLAAWPGFLGALDDWLILWPIVLVVLLVAAIVTPRALPLFPVLSLLAVLTLDTLVFVVTPWDVEALMEASAARLLLQVAPLAVFTVAVTARQAGWIVTRP